MLPSEIHFRQAIKYFRRLEAQSLGKSLPETSKKLTDIKKFSLEVSKCKKRKIGGSLNLPNLSSRFGLTHVYEDVFGNKKSFRGVPNRSALVEALATFSRSNDTVCDDNRDEDDIKFDLFKKNVKSKKRKSLRSVFDIYY